jgi:hypothetical protein
MSTETSKLFSIARALVKVAKSEYGEGYNGLYKLKALCQTDHFAKLLLSKVPTVIDQAKVLYICYYLLNDKNTTPEQIVSIVNNLYVVSIYEFDDTTVPNVLCDYCDGTGEEECSDCRGIGRVDCSTCDGEGYFDCDSCGSDGTEDCRQCDGTGRETDYDENDEEIEVSCDNCDGTGKDDCRDCGGTGNFECYECNGGKTEKCGSCDSYGEVTCDYCGGDGEVEGDEEYYRVTESVYLTTSSDIEEYLNEPISEEDWDDRYDVDLLPNSLIIRRYTFNSEYSVENTNDYYGMGDSFVVPRTIRRIENSNLRILFN